MASAQTWDRLQHASSKKLMAMQTDETDQTQKAWIDLALISKHDSVNSQQLAQDILTWREHNPSHPGNEFLPDNNTLQQMQHLPHPQHIAILLPQQGPHALAGQKLREGFLNAYYANMEKAGKISVKFYDTSRTQNIAALYQQAVTEGADFVIGPLLKSSSAIKYDNCI